MFPLFGLPNVAYNDVYQYMNLPEIMCLVECSKNASYLVRKMMPSHNGLTCELRVVPGRREICVKNESKEVFKWSVVSRRHEQAADTTVFVDRTLNGVLFRVCPTKQEYISIDDTDEHFIHLIGYLKELFSPRTTSIDIRFHRPFDFSQMMVQTDVFRTADRICVNHGFAPHAELTFLLDNCVTQNLELKGSTPSEFTYDNPIRFPIVTFDRCPWNGTDFLMDLVSGSTSMCRMIYLKNLRLAPEDLNKMIRRWMAGDNVTLECVWTNFQESNLETIFDGIPNSPGTKKRPEASQFYQSNLPYETGRDIRRNDGLLATLVLQLEPRRAIFTTWHCLDPNLND